jgi:hypothetical protein
MKVLFNKFFNDLDLTFFILIFKRVFNEDISYGSFDDSDILIESCFGDTSLLDKKQWKHTFFFSGESDRRLDSCFKINKDILKKYDCVLKGEKTNENIVNVPLFCLYTHIFNYKYAFVKHKRDISRFPTEYISTIPPKNVCIIVSNAVDHEGRNTFFDKLEQKIHIDYAGAYKNNVSRVADSHMTPEFIKFVSQYKFIITMENSKNKDYITEKIITGFAANTIPVYWGSDNIMDYFNEERFINVKTFSEEDMNDAINKTVLLLNDDNKYLEIINKPIYKNNTVPVTIDGIAKDIQKLFNIQDTQKKTFITFGGPSQNFHNSVNRIVSEAKELNYFDEIHGYTDIDLKNATEFWNAHKNFMENSSRGYGFWIWKSYLIKTQLTTMKENDILVYCDAGCTINKNGINRLNEYIDMLNNNDNNYGIISFQLEFQEGQYTKKAIFDYFHTEEHIKMLPQCLGGILLIRKNSHSMNIIDKWYEASMNHGLIDTTLSSNESPHFIENRNDQSLLSVIVNTNGSIKLKDETYFGGAWDTDGKMYPFWATRLK